MSIILINSKNTNRQSEMPHFPEEIEYSEKY
jgi:hypothetical protein